MPALASSRPAPLVLASLLALLLGPSPARAQTIDCNAPTVAVFGPSDVNGFSCTEIAGNLQIGPGGGDLTSLSGLSELTSVGGDVVILSNPALTSLTGLENLETIGGNLEIGNPRFIDFDRNDALVTLTGLDGLTSVGGSLMIWDNPGLQSLEGLESLMSLGSDLFIAGNPELATLKGLEGLTAVPGNLDLGAFITIIGSDFVGDNPALASLEGLANLASVGGSLTISRTTVLESLDGLENLTTVGSGFAITFNEALVSIEALESLMSVDGWLNISSAPVLISLDGLEALTSVGIFTLVDAPMLTSITGLASLTSVSQYITIARTALASLEGLEGLTTLDGGSITIAGNPFLTSLRGLDNLTFVGGLGLGDNPLLTSLSELSGLTGIGTFGLSIGDDTGDDGTRPPGPGLVSLTGLEGVTSIAGRIDIFNTGALASLDGLDNLTSIGFGVFISNNVALTSLGALARLTSIGQEVFITSNPALPSLDGLEKVTSIGQTLGVFGNDTLTDCACGLRGLISGDPPMFTGVPSGVAIETNKPDGLCTSPEVVLAVPLSSCAVPLNAAPIADAGPDQSVSVGQMVTLDGTGSSDPDDDPITYAWTLDAPEGSAAALSDPTLASPTFTADVAGDYTATLIVNDGTVDSAPDVATISATTVISIVGCTPEAPLLFSDWSVEPGEDPRGEYVELTNDAGANTSVRLVGCSFLVFDPFTETVTYAAPLPASVLPGDGNTYSFANTVTGRGQTIPPNTLPDRPSVFALVEGSASVDQSVLEVLTSSSVVAAVVVDRDGTEFGSVRGGENAAANTQALLDALAGLQAVAGEDGADLDLELTVAPNPASGQSTVSFGLTTGAEIQLMLYDALGREVIRLVDGTRGPGHHEIALTTDSLPTGVYVVRLTTDTDSQSILLTLSR